MVVDDITRMDPAQPRYVARGRSVLNTLLIFPACVIVTLIPWLTVIFLRVVSRHFDDAGRHEAGTARTTFAVDLAVATAPGTVSCFIAWSVALVRTVRELETSA